MRLIKRSLKVLPLALVAASLMAPPAMAADPLTIECGFTGLAGNLSPPVRPIPQTGGGGSFTFGGTATCTVTHGSTVATGNGTINASGSYTNTICGTGSAGGNATIAFPPNPTGITSATVPFTIIFVAGVGVFQIPNYADNLGHKGNGAGEVTIVPAQGSCTSGGVTAFTVAGAFAIRAGH